MIKYLKFLKRIIYIKITNLFISKNKIYPKIIVFGFQKSGTTAIAKLLALNTGMSVTIDPPILWKGIPKVIKNETTIDKVIFNNKVFFTTQILKEPGLTLIANDVINLFPNSKYICIVRNPFENIRSILNRLDLRGDYDILPSDVFNNVNPNWKGNLTGELYGINRKSYIEVLALLWVKYVNVYLNKSDMFLLIKYEDFNKNKKQIIEKTAMQLGFESINDISTTMNKQFQPKGKKVDLKAFFGETNYLKIEQICGKLAGKFGY